ncbi:glycosyltransferase family 4 protein [Pseudomonas sp. NCCP-436]|uniref:MraY family glycosyltransferase n=1 Tax=Pseudomonas sp. NCCP-436 TaxID=2842481 RepID=UPI001C81F497|nr:glycosyltransferase family 4 protein [Pseudomonas sp. NCCP-436]GIZ11931.1 glycosyltransferase WbpL [Pseudomonas sp. NCCP-436]
MIGLCLAGALLASWGLTAWMRCYALKRQLLDVPNARSSHAVPTPRGGGMAIVLVFLALLPVLMLEGFLPLSVMWALCGGGAWIALLGFLDDHGHVAARWRLLGHFVAAGWVLVWLGGLPPLALAGLSLDLGWLGHGLALFGLVWLLNLYNFMDGIDGIAAVEAICACSGGALLYLLLGQSALLWLPLSLGVAVAGFLYWNFPPARIFMGDAGSGFLGLMLGALALQAAWLDSELLWAWLILLGVFVVDATWTVVHRLIRGERVYEAHRSHAYQFASRRFRRHLPVTLAVAVINLLWLLPLAVAVALGYVPGLAGLVLAYVPLGWLAWRFRAGAAE